MAPKIFKQAFAKDFQGISGECAAIEPDAGEVNRAVNYEYSVGNSLRGRVGCQTSGYGFFAMFPYRYTRTQDQYTTVYQVGAGVHPNQTPTLTTAKVAADGTSIEKLIALNQQVWTLDHMDITITQTNAGVYTWYSFVSGSHFHFAIKKDGAVILDQDVGDGLGGMSGTDNIYALLGVIDGLGDLAVSRTNRGTCPPFAIVNGAQTTAFVANMSWGKSYSVTVANTPHNFYPGDVITFNLATGLVGGLVLARTATTITYGGPQVSLSDGAILGYMGQPSAAFNISTVSSETAGSLIISFPYWRLIPEGDSSSIVGEVSRNYGNIFKSAQSKWAARTAGDFYAPATAVNAEGCLYIAASSSAADFAGGFGSGTGAYANSLIKVDDRTAFRAGLAKPDITPAAVAAGALTGTYKYKCFMRRYDSQNNITDGPVSSVKTVTYAAQYGSVTLISNLNYLYASGFGHRMAYKYTTETPAAPANFFYIDDNTAAPGVNGFIQPGDRIFLTDTTAQKAGLWQFAFGVDPLGTLHKTVCTGYDGLSTPSSISVADSSGYTIPNNSHINTGLTFVTLRTAAGGNQYYVLSEVPVDLIASTQAYFDNVTDAVLTAGEQYIEVPIGKEHDAPAACSLVCEHQGGLVVARGPIAPNTVAFSSAEGGLECFPVASNYFDIPSTQSGFITAIASDTTDRLSVFKERAYYDIQGDLDGGIFSVNVRNEGDYGITSQASLKRVNNALWGLSKNGWVVIQDGFLDPYRFREVSARLINQSYQWAWAVAENDYFNRQYICSIPQVTGEPVTYTLDYSRNKIITLERSYATQIDPVGGMAMIGDTLYHLSQTYPYGLFRRLIRFNGNSPHGGNGDSFLDNTSTINYVLESQPINFGEPGQLKTPIRVRIWSVPNDFVVEGWVPFSLLVETGANPLSQYVGSGGTNNTSSTVTFAADTDIYKDIKLVKQKCHFYIIRFTTNASRTAPFITGYEIMFAENYEKEDLVK